MYRYKAYFFDDVVLVNPEEFLEEAGNVTGLDVGIDTRKETQEEDAAGGIAQPGILFAGIPLDVSYIFMRTECFNVGRKDGVVNVFDDTAYCTFLVVECLFCEGFTQRMLRTEQLDGAGTCQYDVIFIAQQGFRVSFQQMKIEEPEEVVSDKHHLYIHGFVVCLDKLFVGAAHGAPVFYFRITAL